MNWLTPKDQKIQFPRNFSYRLTKLNPSRVGESYQDQDSLLVKRRNDNHSPGPVIRELVPSSHQRSELSNTILCIFSGWYQRIGEGIPIPDSLGEEATFINICIGNGSLKCHRVLIPTTPSFGDKVIGLRFKYTTKFSLPKIACPAIVYVEIVAVIDPFFVGVCPWIKVYRYNPTEICQQRLQGVRNEAQKLCSWERSFIKCIFGGHEQVIVSYIFQFRTFCLIQELYVQGLNIKHWKLYRHYIKSVYDEQITSCGWYELS